MSAFPSNFLTYTSTTVHPERAALEIATATCIELVISLVEETIEGPTTTLTFLGTQVNRATISTTSLPADRLVKATGHGEVPSSARSVRHWRELVSLVGHLV